MQPRPAIVSISESADDSQARVVITLSYQDGSYEGEAIGSPDPAARPRLVAEATLRAVEQVIDGAVRFTVEAVATTDLGGSQIAMAQIVVHGTDERLVGSSLIDGPDNSAAAVRAVMDALNRRLDRLG